MKFFFSHSDDLHCWIYQRQIQTLFFFIFVIREKNCTHLHQEEWLKQKENSWYTNENERTNEQNENEKHIAHAHITLYIFRHFHPVPISKINNNVMVIIIQHYQHQHHHHYHQPPPTTPNRPPIMLRKGFFQKIFFLYIQSSN